MQAIRTSKKTIERDVATGQEEMLDRDIHSNSNDGGDNGQYTPLVEALDSRWDGTSMSHNAKGCWKSWKG